MSDSDSDTSDNEEEVESKPKGLEAVEEETKREKVVKYSTGASALVNVINLPVAFASGGAGIAMAIPAAACGGTVTMVPIAKDNEEQITDILAVMEVSQKMMEEINRMKEENKKLRATIEKLEATVGSMEDTQDTHDAITKQQTQSIDDFEKQVQKQKELLREMQEDARSGMLQMLLTFIVANDVDGDFKIDPEEVDPLVDSIEGSKSLGVNRELFRKKVEENNGEIQAVLDMCADIMQPPEDDEGEDKGLKEDQVFWILENS